MANKRGRVRARSKSAQREQQQDVNADTPRRARARRPGAKRGDGRSKKRSPIEDQEVTLSPARGETGLADYAMAGREADEMAGDEGVDDDLR